MYEGVPNFPGNDRFWQIVEKYRVTIFYTAPTAIRTIMKWGHEEPPKHDLSSLRILGSVGEPINPEAWMWYHTHIGGERCPIVDTWWQTETGGIMISPLPGATTTKPGSATFPLRHLRRARRRRGKGRDQRRRLPHARTRPWPSMLRGIWGDPSATSRPTGPASRGRYFAGDGAKLDDDGYLWLLGRVDDVMNISGHRISTTEVESALVSTPPVAEAAVVGANDATTGQAIIAYVITRTGADVGVEDLRASVAAEIGAIAEAEDNLPRRGPARHAQREDVVRRLLRDVADGRNLGDTTTLADATVVDEIQAPRRRRPAGRVAPGSVVGTDRFEPSPNDRTGIFLLHRLAAWRSGTEDDERADAEGLVVGDMIEPVRILVVLVLAFVLVQTFVLFEDASDSASAEAGAVIEEAEAAQLLPESAGPGVVGALRCYARAVVGPGWGRVGSNPPRESPVADAASTQVEDAVLAAEALPGDSSVLGSVQELERQRIEAWRRRLDEAQTSVPGPVTAMVFCVAVLVGGSAALIHRRARPAVSIPILVVTGLVFVATLLVIADLDRPFGGVAKIEPSSMEAAERHIAEMPAAADPPCDETGARSPAGRSNGAPPRHHPRNESALFVATGSQRPVATNRTVGQPPKTPPSPSTSISTPSATL